MNELWFDIKLAEASKKNQNLVICSEYDLHFGEKTSIFDTFSQISGNILYFSCNTLFNCKWVMIWRHISWYLNKWIIWQFARKKTFILGIKHPFLHRFLEIFYIFLVTHDSAVNELRFVTTLADTTKKLIILPLTMNKTFILGRKHSCYIHFFLHISGNIVSFLKTYYLRMNEYWIVISLSEHIKKRMILLFVRHKAFIFGRNHSFFTKYHRFLEICHSFTTCYLEQIS